MNYLYKKVTFILSVLYFFPLTSFAAEYILISPRGDGAPSTVSADSANTYFNDLFITFITVAIIFAIIKLMICGLQYTTSESISSKGAAKTCIQYTIGGLLIIFTSVILLNTINTSILQKGFDEFLSGSSNVDSGKGAIDYDASSKRLRTKIDPFKPTPD